MSTRQPSLILVTNDDGVHAPGLRALALALAALGRVEVVAPEQDSSAASHSLTMSRPLRLRRLADGVHAVNGTPTDCVTLAVGKLLPRLPDLVASGINPGPNLGDDISYSGTVAAAKEGTMLGVPSMAVSLAGNGENGFETAATVAVKLAERVLAEGLPCDTLLNLNVPAVPRGHPPELRFTRQGRRTYEDAIQETFDPWGRKHYWIGGGTPYWDEESETDARAVEAGFVSVTPLHLDLTNYQALKVLRKKWPRQL